jgi:Flp pilus assembly protein TadD
MDAQGAELLRKALAIESDNADVLHSMGLLRVRQHDYAGALELLRRAHELAADNARYAYVYAVALNSTGAHGDALALLEQTHRQHPADRDVLFALVSIARDAGNLDAALHARELVDHYPADPQFGTLLQELQRQQAH